MNIEKISSVKITPTEKENYLTLYQEGNDISAYEGVKTIYVPSNFDTSKIREITPEEDAAYKQARDSALQAEGDSIVNG